MIETCHIICDYSYGTDYESAKPWLSQVRTDEHKYPLVHSTNKDGPRFYWTSTNTRGHFGIPKVIFGESGINEPILDLQGEYGMTQDAMALVITSEEEGRNIIRALKSEGFQKVLSACSWSIYRIDWRLFTYFRKDFWKAFID